MLCRGDVGEHTVQSALGEIITSGPVNARVCVCECVSVLVPYSVCVCVACLAGISRGDRLVEEV